MLKSFFIACCLGLLSGSVLAGEIHERAPRNGDPDLHYVFYMHGLAVEKGGRRAKGSRGRIYEYDQIVAALATAGFEVISEARPKDTKPPRYVKKLQKQVRKLIKSGVPAEHITITGHSKGGFMTLMASSMMETVGINFVVLAGCGTQDKARISRTKQFTKLSGRVLSTYDVGDREAGSCQAVFDRAPGASETGEVAYDTGEGHALYYAPKDVWIKDIVTWAKL